LQKALYINKGDLFQINGSLELKKFEKKNVSQFPQKYKAAQLF